MLAKMVSTLVGLAFLIAPGFASPNPLDCTGCKGGADAGVDSPGSCGGAVAISVALSDGFCFEVQTYPPRAAYCYETSCHAVITRSWSGLPEDDPLKFCNLLLGVQRCIEPPPTAGSGSGSDTKQFNLDCSGNPWTFSVASESCGLFASAMVTCTDCE